MATELLQAEFALAELAEQFEHWRRTRATAQERIPPALWDQAVALTTWLPRSQVAKRLRLSPSDLKKQCLARPTAIPAANAHRAGPRCWRCPAFTFICTARPVRAARARWAI